MTVMTSREFDQNTAKAKRKAAQGPVIITLRAKPAHVLMSMDEYERMRPKSVGEVLAMPEGCDFDFEPPRMPDIDLKIPDFD